MSESNILPRKKDTVPVNLSDVRAIPLKRPVDEKSNLVLAAFVEQIESLFFQFDTINCNTVEEFEENLANVAVALTPLGNLFVQTRDSLFKSLLAHVTTPTPKNNNNKKEHQKKSRNKKVAMKKAAAAKEPSAAMVRKISIETQSILNCACKWLLSLWQHRACTLFVYNRSVRRLANFCDGHLQKLPIQYIVHLASEMQRELGGLVRANLLDKAIIFAPFAQVLSMQLNVRLRPIPPVYLNPAVPRDVVGVEPFIEHLAFFAVQMNDGEGEPALGGKDLALVRERLVSLWTLYWYSVYEAEGCRFDANPAYLSLFNARWILAPISGSNGVLIACALARLYQAMRTTAHQRLWLQDHMILQTWCDRVSNLQAGLAAAQIWVVALERDGILEDFDLLRAAAEQDQLRRYGPNAMSARFDSQERLDNTVQWITQVHGTYAVSKFLQHVANVEKSKENVVSS